MGFFRQEYWSGLSPPSPGELPNPGIEPTSLMSPALAGGFFTTKPPEKPYIKTIGHYSDLKRNELSSHEKTRRNLKWILLRESSQSKRLFSIWYFGKSKTIGTVKISGCQGLECEAGMSSLNRELLGQLKSLNGTITADTCLYIFVQTHRMENTKSGL